MGRTPQPWRDPRHQEARQVAATLVDDLSLYHEAQAPRALSADAPPEAVRAACAKAFGPLWARVQASYEAKVPADVRAEHDHLAACAMSTWGPDAP